MNLFYMKIGYMYIVMLNTIVINGLSDIPYMCMNKVLVSRYKKVTFPIVSYPELVEIISGATRE
jgi:hypothetical protein